MIYIIIFAVLTIQIIISNIIRRIFLSVLVVMEYRKYIELKFRYPTTRLEQLQQGFKKGYLRP